MSDVEQSTYPEIVQRLSEANVGTAIVPPLARLPLGNLTTNVLFGRNILLFQVRATTSGAGRNACSSACLMSAARCSA